MNTLKFWLVFSVGVAAGATVSLIYAPQDGKKTRKQLKRKLDNAGDYLKDQLDDAGEYLKDQADELGGKAAKVYKSAKEAAADASESLSGNVQTVVGKAKSAIS
ncbi:YtxH domain-containing protein [Acidipila sp. EB88]|uniref:YtxH domain-containing protein n=1 Tax=Acidipila sp. EB88 TaxID=2305226 RepID=UPI000F5FE255|nr:YtxH domain-containing protein [Acidipila sp. EB88]RRA49068.1 YtxH domain-containing protein [Acidipila sp. EB88]